MSEMSGASGEGNPPRTGAAKGLPVAAVAGALVLAGLVGFSLYRRFAAHPGGASSDAEQAADAGDPTAPAEGTNPAGTAITARVPARISPEAAILAERYRCVCGCNDPLALCTCQIPGGADDMKAHVETLAVRRLAPEEADKEMEAKFGPAALLANPAPPQTRPSHAGAPPAAGAATRH